MGGITSVPLDILRSFGLTIPSSEPLAVTNDASSRPLIQIYAESLCPYCQKFFDTQLAPIKSDELLDYFDISVIPFGNASWNTTNNQPNCQHGMNECYFNVVQQAVIETYPLHYQQLERLQKYLCIEDVVKANQITSDFEYDEIAFESYWKNCFDSDSLEIIKDIVSQEIQQWNKGIVEGTLFEKYQTLTSLVIDRKFVPWFLLDGEYNEGLQKDLKTELCKAIETSGVLDSKDVCIKTD